MNIKVIAAPVIAALLWAPVTVAEIWKDYELSKEVTELTVVQVKPNYVDTYLTRLESTWISSMEIQKEMGYVLDYNVWVAPVAAQPNVFLTVTYPNRGARAPKNAMTLLTRRWRSNMTPTKMSRKRPHAVTRTIEKWSTTLF